MAEYCGQVRPDIDAKKAFVDFRFYFTQGQGAEKRRSQRGWNQAWQGWVRRQREEAQRPQSAPANRRSQDRVRLYQRIVRTRAGVKALQTGDVGPYGAGCMT